MEEIYYNTSDEIVQSYYSGELGIGYPLLIEAIQKIIQKEIALDIIIFFPLISQIERTWIILIELFDIKNFAFNIFLPISIADRTVKSYNTFNFFILLLRISRSLKNSHFESKTHCQ